VYDITYLQALRVSLANEEADLRRLESETPQDIESTGTTKRNIEEFKARIALFPQD
jgi:hypothetical protein